MGEIIRSVYPIGNKPKIGYNLIELSQTGWIVVKYTLYCYIWGAKASRIAINFIFNHAVLQIIVEN